MLHQPEHVIIYNRLAKKHTYVKCFLLRQISKSFLMENKKTKIVTLFNNALEMKFHHNHLLIEYPAVKTDQGKILYKATQYNKNQRHF